MTISIGYVYLLSNPALEGIIKIGHTKRADVSIRAEELSSSTSIPLPFVIEGSWLVENPSQWEARIHARLAFCRVAKDREFFRIDTSEAEAHIYSLIYGTKDRTEAIVLEMKSLVALYRKFPAAFKNSDELVAKVENALFSISQT
ncbi:GIY-YIG nuclease family protein [Pseudomonas fluorescens]|uniref:GIY-YIG nuclease family protein n=1 Tax=Pseudomonas fluorescens TaxID=294 RepID=UPI00124165F2|nr:GIY-YIG nuclease family protein [Pseudomonas fluorescens]